MRNKDDQGQSWCWCDNNTETFVARTQRAMMSRVVENGVWRGRYRSSCTRSFRPSELWILSVMKGFGGDRAGE